MGMASSWLTKTGKLKPPKFRAEGFLSFQACDSQIQETLTSCPSFLLLSFSLFQSDKTAREFFFFFLIILFLDLYYCVRNSRQDVYSNVLSEAYNFRGLASDAGKTEGKLPHMEGDFWAKKRTLKIMVTEVVSGRAVWV